MPKPKSEIQTFFEDKKPTSVILVGQSQKNIIKSVFEKDIAQFEEENFSND